MKTLIFSSEFFNVKDTLECGQIFRFKPYREGFIVFSSDKACYAYTKGDKTYVETDDAEYFYDFFDIKEDYSKIFGYAKDSGYEIVRKAAISGKGIRILRQNPEEALYSFIISQNNNIPRIKKIIESTCSLLGKEKEFMGEKYFAFPTFEDFATKAESFYASLGYGYRAAYITAVSDALKRGFKVDKNLPTSDIKSQLLTLKGVGPKVADCVSLFGYHRTDSFPVDTWIEKLYREDFKGEEKDRKKITEFFQNAFGNYSGYIQQYVFFYKRGG